MNFNDILASPLLRFFYQILLRANFTQGGDGWFLKKVLLDLRLRYQGLVPPTQRTREHFDAGSKYHVVSDSDQDYIKYFVATVLQFQIFSELCLASGHVVPLHTCNIYRSRDAGRLISLHELMQQGASSQLIRMLTRWRTSPLSPQHLLDYFRPL